MDQKLVGFFRKLQLHTLPREPGVCSSQVTGGREKTIQGEVSQCAVGTKKATMEVCQSNLGKGLDWIRDITRKDLGNRLVKGWPIRGPGNWAIWKWCQVLPKPNQPNKELSLFLGSQLPCYEDTQKCCGEGRCICWRIEASCQQPWDGAIFETDPSAPVKPLYNCSPGQQLDCNLMKDPEPDYSDAILWKEHWQTAHISSFSG